MSIPLPPAKSADLFATRVWQFDLTHLSPKLDGWKHLLEMRRAAEGEGRGRSTRNGWSGPKTLFADAELLPLRQACEAAFMTVLAEMKIPAQLLFRMEAWGNINDPGGYNLAHIHREAMLSGTFYLEVPDGAGSITFHDPRLGAKFSRPYGRGVNAWIETTIRPTPGTLIIFPHWLEHSVAPNTSEHARYSIAMNAVAMGMRPANEAARQ